MFALSGVGLPPLGSAGQVVQVNALGTAYECASITSAAAFGTKLASGSAAGIAGGTYINSPAFAAQTAILIKLTLTDTSGASGTALMRFNADGNAVYGFFEAQGATHTAGATAATIGVNAPSVAHDFVIIISRYASRVYRGDGVIVNGTNQNSGTAVYTLLDWSPNPAAAITAVNFTLSTNFNYSYEIWGA